MSSIERSKWLLTIASVPVLLCGQYVIGQASTDSSTLITVTGQVTNAVTKTPISRVLVHINDRGVLTDHDGKFSFDGVSSTGAVALRANKPGFYATPEGETVLNTSVAASSFASPLKISLYPEAILTGTLTSKEGTPLGRVQIMARRSTYNNLLGRQWIPAQQHLTNSRGEFRLAVPPGDYRVEVGFSPRQTSQVVIPLIYPSTSSSDTSSSISFHLSSGAQENLSLQAETGPAFSVQVKIDGISQAGFPMLIAHTASGATMPLGFSRGSAESVGTVQLPAGTYTLTANRNFSENNEYGEAKITVSGPNSPPVTLRLNPAPIIPIEIVGDSGTTSDNALPTAQQLGLMLIASQSEGMDRPGSAGLMTSRNSSNALRVTPGTYRLVSTSNGGWYISSATYGGVDLLRQDLNVAPGGAASPIRVTVSNRTGSAGGTCRLSGTPGPAWIYLVPLFPSTTPLYVTRSGATGAFNFNYLPEGSYHTIAFEQRHLDDFRSPEVLGHYTTWTRDLKVTTGTPASIDIDAVPMLEMQP